MLIYKLEVEIIGDDWGDTEFYFFKSYDEREKFKKKYEKEHVKKDESYISNIRAIRYYLEENVFNNLKNQMTISQYEELFNVTLNEDN